MSGALCILFQFYFFTIPRNAVPRVVIAKDQVGHTYDTLVSAVGENLDMMSYTEKCNLFFSSLFTENQAWQTQDFRGLPYHQQIFERKDYFINDKLKHYRASLMDKTEEEKDKIIEEKNIRHVYEVEYDNALKETQLTEKYIIDAATTLRVYSGCYLDQFGKLNTKRSDQHCSEIENRLFRWASRASPEFTRWDGKKMNRIPIMSDYVDQGMPYEKPQMSGCYMRDLRDQFNGKGFAISAADKHLDQLVSLFALLRATNNTLPIQIVHSGDLGPNARKILVHSARTLDLNVTGIDNIYDVMKTRNLDFDIEHLTAADIKILYPPLELWFVDVSGAVSKDYRGKFNGFANKLLAYFFSSFQHVLLIDTDMVPMTDLDETILQSPLFEEYGTHFFRDREILHRREKSDGTFFAKLMPSSVDELLFNIPRSTAKTLENRYIGKSYYHVMESGVVAVDKRRHFSGVLGTLQLQIWSPVLSKIHGDKELFWLGMSMMGDEGYYMNHWPAGSAGQITPREQRYPDDLSSERRNRLKGKELCSTHPSHLSPVDNTTLLWFNAGIQNCKNLHAAQGDINNGRYKYSFDNVTQLEDFYDSYQKIEAIIVPKEEEYYINNQEGENTRGWASGGACSGYLFCSFDIVGGSDDPEAQGILVEFDQTQRQIYNFYASSGRFYMDLFKLHMFKKEKGIEF
jgi:hypothetical protein